MIRILARDGSVLADRGAAHDFMPIDMLPQHVIDAVVAQRVAMKQLTPAQALVAREQMQIQFRSLSAVEQRRLLAASRNLANEEAVLAAQKSLQDAVVDEARNALAGHASACCSDRADRSTPVHNQRHRLCAHSGNRIAD